MGQVSHETTTKDSAVKLSLSTLITVAAFVLVIRTASADDRRPIVITAPTIGYRCEGSCGLSDQTIKQEIRQIQNIVFNCRRGASNYATDKVRPIVNRLPENITLFVKKDDRRMAVAGIGDRGGWNCEFSLSRSPAFVLAPLK